MPKNNASRRIDLTNQVFEDLIVVRLSEVRNKHNTLLWECRCSCGKIVFLPGTSLRGGHYKSCGCKQVAKRDAGVKRHIASDRVDGTRISALKAKLHVGNKSGHKGVAWLDKRNKWRAYIGWQGKNINLGYFSTLEEAIAARVKAEEEYHNPLIDKQRDK
ncbi:HNH endonuclease [Paenibacillaceae bacterium]|nr:HNH endonuclease [Paenibacillaceae bacterium]